jgi:hypothetical protein
MDTLILGIVFCILCVTFIYIFIFKIMGEEIKSHNDWVNKVFKNNKL